MKNICENCKYNDKPLAKKLFYSNNYCTLWGCQMSGKDPCIYKVKKDKPPIKPNQ